MTHFWKNSWFSITVLVFFAVCLMLTLALPYGDEILIFNDLRDEPLNTFFRFATKLGEALPYYLVGAGALFFRYRFALLIALTGLLVMPVSYMLKDKIGTDRPITFFEKEGKRGKLVLVPAVVLASGQTSFPSGHTMSAFALASVVTGFFSKKFRWMGLLTAYSAILVGISRVFLVQHFLADIFGGAVVGLLIGGAVFQISRTRWFSQIGFLEKNLLSVV